MNLPPIRYARTSDDVSIAYMALGDGPPIVFASNVFGEVAFYSMPWFSVRGFTDGLVARSWRVVRYDVRGTGYSDRDVTDLSLEARVRDLEAVVEALGVERFALAGVDFGVPTAVAFADLHADAVSHLVLVSAWARGANRFAIPGARVATAIQPSEEQDWRYAARAISGVATDFKGPDSAKAAELADATQQATSPRTLAAHRNASLDIDVTDFLPRLTMPTLVTHDPYFAFGSFDLCREVAASIPDAVFVTVDENSLAGDTHERHVAVIDQFLRSGNIVATSPPVPVYPAEPLIHLPRALTAREAEVLSLLAAGFSNKEIAARLTLAVPTVERHLVNVYAKIGARGRADATAYALYHGLDARRTGDASTRFP